MLPRKRWFSGSLARPIVTSFFELKRELFPSTPNDSTRYHHMDVVRDDIVQEALVVRN